VFTGFRQNEREDVSLSEETVCLSLKSSTTQITVLMVWFPIDAVETQQRLSSQEK